MFIHFKRNGTIFFEVKKYTLNSGACTTMRGNTVEFLDDDYSHSQGRPGNKKLAWEIFKEFYYETPKNLESLK